MVQLVRDPSFEDGLLLLAPQEGQSQVIGTLDFGRTATFPVWRLAQWNTRHSLAAVAPTQLSAGGVEYRSDGLRVARGADGADLLLGIQGRNEYGGRLRRQGEPWVHLLVEQDFSVKPKLLELASLQLEVEARLAHAERHAGPGYTPNLHAAQFFIYFIIQNQNLNSRGFGDYLWFGVPFYDDRNRVVPLYAHADFNTTGRFIYTPSSREYFAGSMHDGEWVSIQADLLPLIQEGLRVARSRGFLPNSPDDSDFRVSYMNMGWELPGTFDVEMHIRNLRVNAFMKE